MFLLKERHIGLPVRFQDRKTLGRKKTMSQALVPRLHIREGARDLFSIQQNNKPPDGTRKTEPRGFPAHELRKRKGREKRLKHLRKDRGHGPAFFVFLQENEFPLGRFADFDISFRGLLALEESLEHGSGLPLRVIAFLVGRPRDLQHPVRLHGGDPLDIKRDAPRCGFDLHFAEGHAFVHKLLPQLGSQLFIDNVEHSHRQLFNPDLDQ